MKIKALVLCVEWKRLKKKKNPQILQSTKTSLATYNPVKDHGFSGKISHKHSVAGERREIVFGEVSNAYRY